MSSIDTGAKIPNNVGLEEDRRLRRALERWQPDYLDWWHQMGPVGFDLNEVYLRTAVSADPKGWNIFGHVRMPPLGEIATPGGGHVPMAEVHVCRIRSFLATPPACSREVPVSVRGVVHQFSALSRLTAA